MDTKILEDSDENIKLCADAIKNGDVVAFGTETVYGLGACIFNKSAIKKIFALKGRPSDNPLIAHIHSIETVSKIAEKIPEDFYVLAEKFFPGPLTIVLSALDCIPKIAIANKDTIAIRMPKKASALKLIEYVQAPIVAPSANLSGKPSSTTAEHVKEDFNDKIPFILDGGACEIGIESTVILLNKNPYLLRPGAISKEEIESVIKKEVIESDQKHLGSSPGMKYKHYAPNATVSLKELSDAIIHNNFKKTLFLSVNPVKELKTHLLNRQNLFALFRYADQFEYQEVVIIYSDLLKKDTALFHRIEKAIKRK